MYYKLYIDSVFILQMTCNLYLLSLAGQILECTATHKRILTGAAAGAAIVCAVIMMPIGTVGCRILLCAVPVSMCMMRAAYGLHHGKKLIYGSLVMAGCGFFLGSIMIWILNRLRMFLKGNVSMLITLMTGYLSYRILLKILVAVKRRRRNNLKTIVINIPGTRERVRVHALLDTGNHLADPISGAPVCLVSEKLAKQISSGFRPEKYHVIPFRSIGRDKGWLNAYELPELIIEEPDRTIRREHVIVAICNAGISEESIYQMILHPRLLED